MSFSVAKLFFAYGLGNGLYFSLWVGATTVLLPGRPTPPKVYEAIDRYQPTVFYGVPTSYAALLYLTRRSTGINRRYSTACRQVMPPCST
ncbi:MAG: AMP-binding protein [Planctomycetota bacterium]